MCLLHRLHQQCHQEGAAEDMVVWTFKLALSARGALIEFITPHGDADKELPAEKSRADGYNTMTRDDGHDFSIRPDCSSLHTNNVRSSS